jgi:hypothetical protein
MSSIKPSRAAEHPFLINSQLGMEFENPIRGCASQIKVQGSNFETSQV